MSSSIPNFSPIGYLPNVNIKSTNPHRSKLDDRADLTLLFGGFMEHMGQCVYEGAYDPKSHQADERGFRTDVLVDALRSQGYTTRRYPGGNFLSDYNWLDGIGPKDQRPRRRELAWQSTETNQFGTNEFNLWSSAN